MLDLDPHGAPMTPEHARRQRQIAERRYEACRIQARAGHLLYRRVAAQDQPAARVLVAQADRAYRVARRRYLAALAAEVWALECVTTPCKNM